MLSRFRGKLRGNDARRTEQQQRRSSLIYATALIPFLGLVLIAAARAQQTAIQVANPTTQRRRAEVLDLSLVEIAAHMHAVPIAVSARMRGAPGELPTQPYASQIDGPKDRLLVLLDLDPGQVVMVDLLATKAVPHAAPRVHARQVPERKDDFAWENDVVAYRVYGPALQATGEITSGIDVWSKRVPGFITESWYKRDLEGVRTHNAELSYHRDNGEGLDSYEVGASRGCGGTAVWSGGRLIPAQNAVSSRILADGPIRVDFTLTYAPWNAAGRTVEEIKRITLDAGARLNHMRSTFRFDGTSALNVAAGLAMHRGAVLHRPQATIASVWDTPQLKTAGRIGTAMVLPATTHARFTALPGDGKRPGHALFIFDIQSGDTIDYFAGTAWSQADTPTQLDFDIALLQIRERSRHPLIVRWMDSE